MDEEARALEAIRATEAELQRRHAEAEEEGRRLVARARDDARALVEEEERRPRSVDIPPQPAGFVPPTPPPTLPPSLEPLVERLADEMAHLLREEGA